MMQLLIFLLIIHSLFASPTHKSNNAKLETLGSSVLDKMMKLDYLESLLTPHQGKSLESLDAIQHLPEFILKILNKKDGFAAFQLIVNRLIQHESVDWATRDTFLNSDLYLMQSLDIVDLSKSIFQQPMKPGDYKNTKFLDLYSNFLKKQYTKIKSNPFIANQLFLHWIPYLIQISDYLSLDMIFKDFPSIKIPSYGLLMAIKRGNKSLLDLILNYDSTCYSSMLEYSVALGQKSMLEHLSKRNLLIEPDAIHAISSIMVFKKDASSLDLLKSITSFNDTIPYPEQQLIRFLASSSDQDESIYKDLFLEDKPAKEIVRVAMDVSDYTIIQEFKDIIRSNFLDFFIEESARLFQVKTITSLNLLSGIEEQQRLLQFAFLHGNLQLIMALNQNQNKQLFTPEVIQMGLKQSIKGMHLPCIAFLYSKYSLKGMNPIKEYANVGNVPFSSQFLVGLLDVSGSFMSKSELKESIQEIISKDAWSTQLFVNNQHSHNLMSNQDILEISNFLNSKRVKVLLEFVTDANSGLGLLNVMNVHSLDSFLKLNHKNSFDSMPIYQHIPFLLHEFAFKGKALEFEAILYKQGGVDWHLVNGNTPMNYRQHILHVQMLVELAKDIYNPSLVYHPGQLQLQLNGISKEIRSIFTNFLVSHLPHLFDTLVHIKEEALKTQNEKVSELVHGLLRTLAVEKDNQGVLQSLISSKFIENVDISIDDSFYFAVKNNNIEFTKILLEKTTMTPELYDYEWSIACSLGNKEMIQKLLADKAFHEKKNQWTLELFLLAIHGHRDLLGLLQKNAKMKRKINSKKEWNDIHSVLDGKISKENAMETLLQSHSMGDLLVTSELCKDDLLYELILFSPHVTSDPSLLESTLESYVLHGNMDNINRILERDSTHIRFMAEKAMYNDKIELLEYFIESHNLILDHEMIQSCFMNGFYHSRWQFIDIAIRHAQDSLDWTFVFKNFVSYAPSPLSLNIATRLFELKKVQDEIPKILKTLEASILKRVEHDLIFLQFLLFHPSTSKLIQESHLNYLLKSVLKNENDALYRYILSEKAIYGINPTLVKELEIEIYKQNKPKLIKVARRHASHLHVLHYHGLIKV